MVWIYWALLTHPGDFLLWGAGVRYSLHYTIIHFSWHHCLLYMNRAKYRECVLEKEPIKLRGVGAWRCIYISSWKEKHGHQKTSKTCRQCETVTDSMPPDSMTWQFPLPCTGAAVNKRLYQQTFSQLIRNWSLFHASGQHQSMTCQFILAYGCTLVVVNHIITVVLY